MTEMTSMVLAVPGMSCGHCEVAIKRELVTVSGVERVMVDLDSKHVTVIGPHLERDAIVAAIDEAGYDVA